MADEMSMTQSYPYYVIPDIEGLATEKDPERLRAMRRKIAANIGDRDALNAILGDATEDFLDFYGASGLPRLSTADTIDSFIEKFGKGETQPEGEDVPLTAPEAGKGDSVLPVAPAVDYAVMMQLEEEASDHDGAGPDPDATLGVIDSFLKIQPAPRIKPKKEPKETEKPSLTESFAKILIKNGNYSRALEIITEISLNNPEKSIYFADQIRFLRKVISLESSK